MYPSKRKEEIISGTSGCGSFVVPYIQPATSITVYTWNPTFHVVIFSVHQKLHKTKPSRLYASSTFPSNVHFGGGGLKERERESESEWFIEKGRGPMLIVVTKTVKQL